MMKNAYALLGEIFYICVLNNGASMICEAVADDELFTQLYLPQLREDSDYCYLSVQALDFDIVKVNGEFSGSVSVKILDELPEWFDYEFAAAGEDRENQIISNIGVQCLAETPEELSFYWVK